MRYFASVLPALAKRRLPVTLFFEVKANLRKAQLRLMRAAGIVDIQPGIESLSGPVLELMRKGVTPLQNIQTLKWCAELGIAAHWNWLWGFPREPIGAYAALEIVVPRLTHLQPPIACGPIRLDRFSPNFTDHDRHGFSAVQPAPGYRDVYPLPTESVANLAYYFKGAYADGRDPSSYTAGLRAAIARWQQVYPESDLLAVDRGEELWVFDSRPGFGGLTTLSGIDRVLYRACDTIRSVDGLAAFAARHVGRPVTPDEVRDRLAPYLQSGLIIEDCGRVLALAVMTGDTEADDRVWQSALNVGVDSGRLILPMT
jgi:ribosomal peptide maturation radical SAM protein 1